MFTTCPKCSLTLVVTTTDLRAAQGFVRCGRCSNVFNALLGLSEERQAAAIARASSPGDSGTPEDSPPYEEPQSRGASSPQPAPAPRSSGNQQASSAPRPTPAQQPAPRPAPSSRLPPPSADDLDDIPDISLEFDATSTDISQVFVQQPARRLPIDVSGKFQALTLPPPEPEPPAADDDYDPQLRAVASQIAPEQPPPQPAPPAPVARQNAKAPASNIGSTGSNPILRMPNAQQPAPQPARQNTAPAPREAPPPAQARQTPQRAPANEAQQQPRSSPASAATREAPAAYEDVPEYEGESEPVVRQSTGAPTTDPPPMVRQSTGAPTADPPPMVRQSTGAPSADPPPAVRQASAPPIRESKTSARQSKAQSNRNASSTRAVSDASTRMRTPQELIEAAAEVVRRADRKRTVARGSDADYDDIEPDVDVVPDIPDSFPNRIRRRALQAIENTDRATQRMRMPAMPSVPLPSLSWSTGAVALSAFFLIQVINHYRDELATSDRLRKPLTALYRAVGVNLVPRWDVGAYEVRQLGALAGPGNSAQLTVRLSVKNGAKSAQPLPYLRVTVQDRFGNRIAARDVPPEVYAPKRGAALLDADQRVDAEIAFVDPGQNAVGFEIDACLPTDAARIACANDQIAR